MREAVSELDPEISRKTIGIHISVGDGHFQISGLPRRDRATPTLPAAMHARTQLVALLALSVHLRQR